MSTGFIAYRLVSRNILALGYPEPVDSATPQFCGLTLQPHLLTSPGNSRWMAAGTCPATQGDVLKFLKCLPSVQPPIRERNHGSGKFPTYDIGLTCCENPQKNWYKN